MKKVFLIFLILRVVIFPRAVYGAESLTPISVPRAEKTIAAGMPEILAVNLILFSVIYGFWRVFLKKDKYYYNPQSGACWIVWQGQMKKIKTCPDEIKKQFLKKNTKALKKKADKN